MQEVTSRFPKIQFVAQPDNYGSRIVGEVYQQIEPFHLEEGDWNDDGDVYGEWVAQFAKVSDVNPHSSNYLTISEWEFNDLKEDCYIIYVKE